MVILCSIFFLLPLVSPSVPAPTVFSLHSLCGRLFLSFAHSACLWKPFFSFASLLLKNIAIYKLLLQQFGKSSLLYIVLCTAFCVCNSAKNSIRFRQTSQVHWHIYGFGSGALTQHYLTVSSAACSTFCMGKVGRV